VEGEIKMGKILGILGVFIGLRDLDDVGDGKKYERCSK
jgi:hypothetical protein